MSAPHLENRHARAAKAQLAEVLARLQAKQLTTEDAEYHEAISFIIDEIIAATVELSAANPSAPSDPSGIARLLAPATPAKRI